MERCDPITKVQAESHTARSPSVPRGSPGKSRSDGYPSIRFRCLIRLYVYKVPSSGHSDVSRKVRFQKTTMDGKRRGVYVLSETKIQMPGHLIIRSLREMSGVRPAMLVAD